jgi:hypothetical protein
MKPLRLRLTVRRLMVLVAIIAIAFGLADDWRTRRAKYLLHARYHGGQCAKYWAPRPYSSNGDDPRNLVRMIGERGKYIHHSHLRQKYEWAARFPWLPVPPDLPEPK